MIMYHPLDACCFIFSGQRYQPVLQIPRRKITNDGALGGLVFFLLALKCCRANRTNGPWRPCGQVVDGSAVETVCA